MVIAPIAAATTNLLIVDTKTVSESVHGDEVINVDFDEDPPSISTTNLDDVPVNSVDCVTVDMNCVSGNSDSNN